MKRTIDRKRRQLCAWSAANIIGLLTLCPAPASAEPLKIRQHLLPALQSQLHEQPISSASKGVQKSEPRDRLVQFDVDHYALRLAIEPLQKTVTGSNQITFTSRTAALRELSFDAVDMRIQAVRAADGTAMRYVYNGEVLTIALATDVPIGVSSVVTIMYEAPLAQSLFPTGGDVTNPERMDAAYTYTQPEGSRFWFPCLDRPEDKATVEVSVDVPMGYRVLSNGSIVSFDERRAGRSFFSYRMEEPTATYLVSLVIGAYDIMSLGLYRDKPLAIWAPAAIKDAMLFDTGRTAAMLTSMERFTGFNYPFSSYTQAAASAWRSSMEHQSATTLGAFRITGDRSGESVVAHELAHQWFGDWVTCRTWGELWLNEGFASYLPYVFYDDQAELDRALEQIDGARYSYFTQALTRVHALSQPEPVMSELFDAHAYSKGALVLHFLRHLANAMQVVRGIHNPGEETFTAALRYYLTQNGGGNVTSANLQQALEYVTGQSWQQIFDQWVRSAGHPVLQASYNYDEQGNLLLTVEQTQFTRTERPWRTFSFPLSVEVILENGQTVRHTVQVYDERHVFRLPLAAAPTAINLDPQWDLPAEISIAQDAGAWREVLRYSPHTTSRLIAARRLSRSVNGSINADVVDLLLADPSTYVQVDALEELGWTPDNRPHVTALWRQLQAARATLNVSARGALAITENWLVQQMPVSLAQQQTDEWQRRFLTTDLLMERVMLLEMLKRASWEQAQTFSLARLAEARWMDSDRFAMVNVLTTQVTAVSRPFIAAALSESTTRTHLSQILTNLVAAHYDEPSLVSTLIVQANGFRDLALRAAFTLLMGEQASSKDLVCPKLTELTRAGLDAVRPDAYSAIRTNALQAKLRLGCEAR